MNSSGNKAPFHKLYCKTIKVYANNMQICVLFQNMNIHREWPVPSQLFEIEIQYIPYSYDVYCHNSDYYLLPAPGWADTPNLGADGILPVKSISAGTRTEARHIFFYFGFSANFNYISQIMQHLSVKLIQAKCFWKRFETDRWTSWD